MKKLILIFMVLVLCVISNGLTFVKVDRAGTNPRTQIVVDTISLGGGSSQPKTLMGRKIEIYNFGAVSLQSPLPAAIKTVTPFNDSVILTLVDSLPYNIVVNDSFVVTSDIAYYFAPVRHASDTAAVVLLDKSVSGYTFGTTGYYLERIGSITSGLTSMEIRTIFNEEIGFKISLDSIPRIDAFANLTDIVTNGAIITQGGEVYRVKLVDSLNAISNNAIKSGTLDNSATMEIADAASSVINTGKFIFPEYVGNGSTDSVIVSFNIVDTTVIQDADSIIVLRFKPNGTLLDSITQSDSRVKNTRTGWYQIRYKSTGVDSVLGYYNVFVRIKLGDKWRGAVSGGYVVMQDQFDNYLTRQDKSMYYWGSCNNCRYWYFPSASSIKDSAWIVDPNNSQYTVSDSVAASLYYIRAAATKVIKGSKLLIWK